LKDQKKKKDEKWKTETSSTFQGALDNETSLGKGKKNALKFPVQCNFSPDYHNHYQYATK